MLVTMLVVSAASAQSRPGVTPCPDGREISPDTAGHCCWSGQAWNGARCVGAPASCPAGFSNDAASQSCVLQACDAGKKRQADNVHCCWPSQAWSRTRSACLGTPKCPAQMEPSGTDDCVPVDKDGDGIPNSADKCPDQPEDKNGFEDGDGCPDEAKRQAMLAAEAARKQREAAVNAVHPLEQLGGARYVGGFGFLLPGDAADAPPPQSAGAEQPASIPAARPLGKNDWLWGVGIDYLHWTDPTGTFNYDLSGLSTSFFLRPEFRSVGHWVTPWLDVRAAMNIGLSNSVFGSDVSILGFTGSGHFGVDGQPWPFFGIGPYVGYRFDYITVSPTNSQNGDTSQSWNSTDNGFELGGHMHLRTLDNPDRVSLFYLDEELFQRQGSMVSGLYDRAEIGVRAAGGFTFYVDAETRMSSSGTPTPGQINNVADSIVKVQPMALRVGAGCGASF